ncbi:tetratricopeptide repeat protein [Psychroflexus sp. YR1-1]|uniref:histidine kinase n=1 Tax=Psychroflexus aurantiacus TaxID=2709310 RepID=A0A6B3RAA4_9FLAO|nr:tetratricopeptide repeat-containing sensor histidine kinase [Psychroflexus aurantiacus]NEV94511.1 tetratricopeptide repeat protein [Psychroflexus aurantiacus]
MKTLIKLAVCLIYYMPSYASHPAIDSLKTELAKVKADSIKVRLYNEIASEFINVSYDSILPYSQKALNLASKINYPKGKGIALKNQAIYYFYSGNQTESKQKIEQAIEIFKEIPDELQLAKAYQNYGILLKNFGETENAAEKYNLAIIHFEAISDKKGVADNLINLGDIYQNQGDFDKAMKVLSEAKKVSKSLNDPNLKASILSGEGLIEENKGNFDTAIDKLTQSLEIFQELDQPRLVLGMYNNLANISRKKGDYLKSIEYFENALFTAREINNPRLQGIILNNLANAYLDINDDAKAASLYKEAMAIIKDIDRTTYACLLSNLAIIQTNQDEFSLALKSLDSSLTIYREQDNKIYIANALSNIAYNYLQLKDIPKAKQFYEEAKFVAEEMGDQYTSVGIYNGLGEVYLKENQLDSAYYFAEKAYSLSKKIKALPEESYAAELLYKIYKSDAKSAEALTYLEIFRTLKDSLFDDEKSKALGKLEAELSFKSLKEQLELERQNQRLENKLKVNRRENYIIGLSSASLVFVLIILLLLRIRKNKTRTNRLLTHKNKEIEKQNIKLNESNTQKNKLFSIISHDLRSPVNNLSQIFEMRVSGQISEEEFETWLPKINKSLTSTRLLIENLLKWASASLNESQVDKTEFLVHNEIQSMEDFFSTALKDKNLILNNKVSKGFKIYMDANAFKLVIRNLISNAIKFCNPGDEITISAITQDGFYRVCVQDTGVGMPSTTAKSLFKDSSITSSIGTRKEDGKGIGTILCRTYVEENDGIIWVDYSETNKGTRICFEVPAKNLPL